MAVKVVYTPLKHKTTRTGAGGRNGAAGASDSYAPGGRSASFGTFGNVSPGAQNMSVDSACLRAPNEDDDGYDPYSDRILPAALFEENPWD
jgi:hypothetical protein